MAKSPTKSEMFEELLNAYCQLHTMLERIKPLVMNELEYKRKLNTKSKETEKIIDIVNKMKEESEKEYENLNKIGNDYDHGDSLNNQQFSVQNTINSVDMEIRNEVAKYESGTKDTNDLGYTEEEFEKLSYDEKVEAIADNNEFMKNMLKSKEISIERLNELTKERTGYDSYEEYQEAISNLESDIAMLELTIARLEEQQKILPYAMLPDTSDFQEFQYNKELKNAKDYLCSNTKYEIDYLRYCKDNGDISPLEFIKLYEEKYDVGGYCRLVIGLARLWRQASRFGCPGRQPLGAQHHERCRGRNVVQRTDADNRLQLHGFHRVRLFGL